MKSAIIMLVLSLISAVPINSNLEKRIKMPTAKVPKVNYASYWTHGKSVIRKDPNGVASRPPVNRGTREVTYQRATEGTDRPSGSSLERSGTVNREMVDQAYQRVNSKKTEYQHEVLKTEQLFKAYNNKKNAFSEADNAVKRAEELRKKAVDLEKSFGRNSPEFQAANGDFLKAKQLAKDKIDEYNAFPVVELKHLDDSVRRLEESKKILKDLEKEYESLKSSLAVQ